MGSPTFEERELIRRLRTGSRAAFEALLDRCERRVYNLALRMLDGSAAEAEDAAQEIFVEVHRSLPGFRGDSRLDTWIHRITVNVCLQRRRRGVVPTVSLDEDLEAESGSDPFREAVRSEMRSVVASAILALPDGQREVVLLHGMQGLSYAEVARALDCPVGTVKSRLSAAFRRLRDSLGAYVAPESPGIAQVVEVRR